MRASGRERRPNAADTAAPPATQVASTPARRALPAASETLVPMRNAPTQRVACLGSSPAQRSGV